MDTLRMFLFGRFRMIRDGHPAEVDVPRSVQPLLAYLLLYSGRAHSREKLTSLFWGDHDPGRARGCLRTALCRLRRLLGPEDDATGVSLASTPSGDVGFEMEGAYWLDVTAFETEVDQALEQPIPTMDAAGAQRLEDALQLYNGDLLEGFYDDWVLWERERLQRLYLNGLAHLLRYYKHQGAYERGVECGRRILFLDPLREEIHREIMLLYLESGRRALAARQYQVCCDILASELNLPPMQETQALYARIAPGVDPRRPLSTAEESTCARLALRQVRLGLQKLQDAQEQIQRALQLIERTNVT